MKLTSVKKRLIRNGSYPYILPVYRALLARNKRHALKTQIMFYKRMMEPGSVAFDIGANVGERSESLLRAGMKVIAVEPQQEPLRECMARCTGLGNFEALEVGVGASQGTKTLHMRKSSSQSSFLKKWEGESAGEKNVHITTLDELINKYGIPNYIKIDVEGFEYEVFKGLTYPAEIISFEYHNNILIEAEKCLRYVSHLGCYEANYTRFDEMHLILKNNIKLSDFMSMVRDRVSQFATWGDIYLFKLPDTRSSAVCCSRETSCY